MCDKMALFAYILKIVEKDSFLRLQMRAKEMFFMPRYGNEANFSCFFLTFQILKCSISQNV